LYSQDEQGNMEWSDHLQKMAPELDRIERQTSADDIFVTTRKSETHVNLVYEHDVCDEGDDE